MNFRARIASLMVLMGGAALTAVGQTPTFQVDVSYVEVDVVVTDQHGTFVRDLKKEEFQVFEDARPQAISSFAVVDLPIDQTARPFVAGRPIEPDVWTNATPFGGRTYVMVIDDLHTMSGRTARVQQAAREFIEKHLGANDLMAVVHTGAGNAVRGFTGNRRLLLADVDKTIGRKVQSATAARAEKYFQLQIPDAEDDPADAARKAGDPVLDPFAQARAFNAQSALGTLGDVVDWFGGVHGRRKAILFVSEGIDYGGVTPSALDSPTAAATFRGRLPGSGGLTPRSDPGVDSEAIAKAMSDVVASATRSDVSVYSIDPRGLSDVGDEDIEVRAYRDDSTPGIHRRALGDELRLSQDSLRQLSEATGGFAAVNRNDFSTAYARIVKDSSSYYVLAYYPPNDKRDGTVHKIEVRTTRPGVTVNARKAYVSPRVKPLAPDNAPRDAAPALRDALNSPIPVSGLALNAFVAPFKESGGSASVLLGAELRGRDLNLGADGTVDLSYFAVDAHGKVWGAKTATLTLSLKPETRTRVEQTGVRLLNRMELPPGRYQLHVAAIDGTKGNAGSVVCDLDVPDFSRGPLLMSGLVLTSLAASLQPTAQLDEQLKAVLPGPPTALREFLQNDEIVVFAELYDNEARSPHTVDITTRVTSAEGKVVLKTAEEHTSEELHGKAGYGYISRLPMQDLAPGRYVLTIEGRSRLAPEAAVSRQVQFSVAAANQPPGR
jgi:VWFA-related protein